MKIGIAQINSTVGDLTGNSKRILSAYQSLVSNGADLVIFPELALCGYPPRDLLFKTCFVSDIEKSLFSLAKKVSSVPAVIGYVEDRGTHITGRPFYNSAAWCELGEVRVIGRKCLLPSYDVFDEERYFEPAEEPTIYTWRGLRMGLTICEDIWTKDELKTSRYYCNDPVGILAKYNIDLLLNLSASPWHDGKNLVREQLVQEAADRCACPVVYCNCIGGNDELIFDGGSIVVDTDYGLIAGLAAFREHKQVVDLSQRSCNVSEHFNLTGNAATEEALVLGLRDYTYKSGFKKALIGLSGGIDSAVVAAIATKALGPENIIGIALPSAISSQHSREDAASLAENLGIEYHELAISEMVESANATLDILFNGLKKDVTEENIQARTRGLV